MRTPRSSLTLLGGIALALGATAAWAQMLPGEKEAHVTAIPGVVSAGAEWNRLWASNFTADGMVGMPDGSIVFAQEQSDKVIKLMPDGTQFTLFDHMNGPGSVGVDADGRMFVAQRSCTEPLNDELAGCDRLTRIVEVMPDSRVLATNFADGSTLGRINDVIADNMGGAFATSNGMKLPFPAINNVFHVDAKGKVTVVDTDIRPNGIMLSRDSRTLYVTNGATIMAYDVNKDGSTKNRREFVKLGGDETFADGMTLDQDGRLYITGAKGIHVVNDKGQELGIIPIPRQAITLAIGGPNHDLLYAGMMGAIGYDGKPFTTPEGIRQISMTIYTLKLDTKAFMGRPK